MKISIDCDAQELVALLTNLTNQPNLSKHLTSSEPTSTPISDENYEMKCREIIPQEKSVEHTENEAVQEELKSHLETAYDFRYNELTQQAEVSQKGRGAFVPITDRKRNSLTLAAINEGVNCWDRDVSRYLNSEEIKAYHPFLRYFENLPEWDGEDRIDPLARRVSADPVWTATFRRWFVAAAAQWMNRAEGQANALAPILISEKQGWGKSTFCRRLLPPELQRYFYERFELSSLDAVEQRLGRYGLINMDEMDRVTDRRMADLKNLIQLPALDLRQRYGKTVVPLHRIASFIGTSNHRDLLTDPTGSRRFFCLLLDHPIDNTLPIDYPQLYAQLRHLVLSGERLWFNKEEETVIMQHNLAFRRQSPAEEVVFAHFRPATADDLRTERAQFFTAAALFAQLARLAPKALRGVSPNSFSRLLPTILSRSRQHNANGYWLVALEAAA